MLVLDKEITRGSLSAGSAGGADCAGDAVACDASATGATAGSGSAGGSTRRRMRAVTGSSAAAVRRAAVPLRGGLDAVGGFQGLDPLGQSRRRAAAARLRAPALRRTGRP